MSAVDFAAIKAVQLSLVVGQSIKLRRNGREWVACCPFHPDKTPSFTVNDDKGFAHCFGCGWHGDAVDFVATISGCGLREAAEQLGAADLPMTQARDNSGNRDKSSDPGEGKAETIEAARRIWREAGSVVGTPGEAYLRRRGIVMAVPPTFRFARLRHPDGGVHPCLVAIVTGPDDKLAGIQRTYLTENGRKASVGAVKLSLGRVRGGAIRLAPAAGELIVCEGAEDGLSLQQELGRTVWVAAGASMLPGMEFPPVVRSVVIGADNDTAGDREARKAAASFAERGLGVRMMRPAAPFKDFNEQLAAGAAGGDAA